MPQHLVGEAEHLSEISRVFHLDQDAAGAADVPIGSIDLALIAAATQLRDKEHPAFAILEMMASVRAAVSSAIHAERYATIAHRGARFARAQPFD
ncbi:MAG TPA: hypothetical protein VEO74_15265 [Thermoanaerobaculia bacterium]|nr:hypothetical protein [Thermoanaerobaculia bacterium]